MTTQPTQQPVAYADPLTKGVSAEHARAAASRILAGPHLSVLATTNTDGSAQVSVIFVKPDGDDILFSTIEGRRKTTNMLRDPRVTLMLHGLPVTGGYATIQGSVQLTDDPGGTLCKELYARYMDGATPPPEPGAHRLIVRICPRRWYAPFP